MPQKSRLMVFYLLFSNLRCPWKEGGGSVIFVSGLKGWATFFVLTRKGGSLKLCLLENRFFRPTPSCTL